MFRLDHTFEKILSYWTSPIDKIKSFLKLFKKFPVLKKDLVTDVNTFANDTITK